MPYSTSIYKDKTFTFHLILDGDKIIHLTASQEKHDKAALQLTGIGTDANITDLPIHNHFQDLIKALIYGSGKPKVNPDFRNNPFLKAGTDFQKRIWHLLLRIGHGKTRTYKQLAETAGVPRGARAVGNACNANPLALVIPCHRVVGCNGSGGYAGGVRIKKELLEIERPKNE